MDPYDSGNLRYIHPTNYPTGAPCGPNANHVNPVGPGKNKPWREFCGGLPPKEWHITKFLPPIAKLEGL